MYISWYFAYVKVKNGWDPGGRTERKWKDGGRADKTRLPPLLTSPSPMTTRQDMNENIATFLSNADRPEPDFLGRSQGRPQGGGKGAMAPPELILGGALPPQIFKTLILEGQKWVFWGAKSILRGAIVENFFALRANLFFALRAKGLAPPSQNPVDAPVYLIY